MNNVATKNLVMGLLLACSMGVTRAQWVAYNDHNRGTGTAPFVSTYSLTKSGTTNVPAGGPLTNFATGLTITNAIGVVGVSISATGSVDSTAITTINPTNYSPAGQLFNGKIDWNLSSIQFGNLAAWSTSSVTIAFTNLTPGRQYKFRGTGGRGLNYSNRWTLATLAGASNATHAHVVATNSPGVVTNGWSPYGDKLNPQFQALWNSGINTCGDVVGWDNIVPINNSFSVISSNWTLSVPSPISGSNSASVFAFAAFSLEEIFAPIAIVLQPQDTIGCPGATVTFSVGVTGNQPAYQWRSVISGVTNTIAQATNATLSVIASGTAAYFVVVTNPLNAVTSQLAHISTGSGGLVITGQPQSQTNVVGSSVTFAINVSSNSSRPITLRWYYSPVAVNPPLTYPIAGGTNLSLSLTNIGTNNVGYYFAQMTNCVNAATSQLASLSAYYVPVQIINDPDDVTVMQNSQVILSAQASGTPPISYQWYKEGAPIANATNASLVFPSAMYGDSGHYYVVAANPAPSMDTSGVAMVLINLPAYNIMPITNYVWKYNQTPLGLDTDNWTAPGYNDSAWLSGRSLLGHCTSNYSGFANNPRLYTNTDLNLVNGGTTNITYYFRTQFVVTNNPAIVQLTASNFYAHGLVVYLNGTEAYRMNMPSGKITYKTVASSAYAPASPLVGVFWPTNIPMSLSSSLLVQGTNTLAVECHKYGPGAPDIYMGVSLSASFPSSTVLQITNDPVSVTIPETQPVTFTVGYIGSPAFSQWYFQHDTNSPIVTLPGATGPSYSPPNTAAGTNDGYYWVTLSNLLSYVTSAQAYLTILPDTNPPVIIDADGTVDPFTITLSFSKKLLLYDATRPKASPTNMANYSVTNTFGTEILTITGLKFMNGTNVILTTSQARQPNVNYIVTVGTNGVEDVTLHHNLAVNIAAPVSTMVTVLDFGQWYDNAMQFLGGSLAPYEAPARPPIDNGGWHTNGFYADQNLGWGPVQTAIAYYYGDIYPLPVDIGYTLSMGVDYGTMYMVTDLPFYGSPANRQVWMRYLVDGGFVMYLNSTSTNSLSPGYGELWRTNMPAGVPTISTFSVSDNTNAVMTDYIPLDSSRLKIGTNRFAVEFHSKSAQDLTMAFAAEITARVDSFVLGKVVITMQPMDQYVFENYPATFSFRGAGAQFFQWKSNNVNIAGATNATYTIPFAAAAMEGSKFSVIVTGVTNSLLSSNATLHVLTDTNPPVLRSAYMTDTNVITVTFDKPVGTNSATNLLNYAVTNAVGPNATIKSIAIGPNGTSVLLTLNTFVPGQFTVVVSNVRDTAPAQNQIISNSRATVGLLNYPLLTMDTNSLWRYNQANDDLSSTGWNTRTYAEPSSGWATGGSLFDVKSGTVRTTIEGYTVATHLTLAVSGSDIPTYYFRKWLTVPVLGPNATMTIAHIIDDAAAFYLNGKLFYAIGVNTGPNLPTFAYSTGNGTRSVSDPVTEGPFNVQLTNMVVGTNLLAVSLHQVNATSSDATFGAMLTLNLPSIVLKPGGTVVTSTNVPPLKISYLGPRQVKLDWTNSVPPANLQIIWKTNVGPTVAWQVLTNNGVSCGITPPVTNLVATNKFMIYRLRLCQ